MPSLERSIQPRFVFVNESREVAIDLYDYPASGDLQSPPDVDFTVRLNGKKLGRCNAAAGFYLRIFVPTGIYRLSFERGAVFRKTLEKTVDVTKPGVYGMRVRIGGGWMAIDDPEPRPNGRI